MSGLVELIFYKCTDQKGDNWYFVPPEEVPEWLKNPEVIDFLVAGHVAQAPKETDIYCAQRCGKSGGGGKPTLLSQSLLVGPDGKKLH